MTSGEIPSWITAGFPSSREDPLERCGGRYRVPAERTWPAESDEELIAELRRFGAAHIAPMLQPEPREPAMAAVRLDFRLVREYSPQRLRLVDAMGDTNS
ncbi:hypothetical protein [Streptomyces sp. NPDC001020]